MTARCGTGEASITEGELLDVTGRSADDVIAVGRIIQDWDSEYSVLRYDGASWQIDSYMLDFPSALGVACTSGDGTYYATKWDSLSMHTMPDTVWSEIAPPSWWDESFLIPIPAEVNRYLDCLEQSGMAVIFFELATDFPHYLSAFDGTEWTLLAGPDDLALLESPRPYLLWGSGQDDLLVFSWGESPNIAVNYLFDGDQFVAVDTPDLVSGVDIIVGVDSAVEDGHGFYAAGCKDPEDGPLETVGLVWHSEDGMSWDEIEVPHPASALAEMHREHFQDVWISGEGQVYVFGFMHNDDLLLPIVLHFDGEEWHEVEVPPHPETEDGESIHLDSVWGIGEELFAVGSISQGFPVILHYVPE